MLKYFKTHMFIFYHQRLRSNFTILIMLEMLKCSVVCFLNTERQDKMQKQM